MQPIGSNDVQLILLIGSKVSESQSGLALDFGRRRVHQVNEGLNELRLGLRKFSSVVGVNGNVTEGCGAIILNINIG